MWAEAVSTSVYVLNRTVSSLCGRMTPYEGWFGRKPLVYYINHKKNKKRLII